MEQRMAMHGKGAGKRLFFSLLFLVLNYLNSELPFFIEELPLDDMPL